MNLKSWTGVTRAIFKIATSLKLQREMCFKRVTINKNFLIKTLLPVKKENASKCNIKKSVV